MPPSSPPSQNFQPPCGSYNAIQATQDAGDPCHNLQVESFSHNKLAAPKSSPKSNQRLNLFQAQFQYPLTYHTTSLHPGNLIPRQIALLFSLQRATSQRKTSLRQTLIHKEIHLHVHFLHISHQLQHPVTHFPLCLVPLP